MRMGLILIGLALLSAPAAAVLYTQGSERKTYLCENPSLQKLPICSEEEMRWEAEQRKKDTEELMKTLNQRQYLYVPKTTEEQILEELKRIEEKLPAR